MSCSTIKHFCDTFMAYWRNLPFTVCSPSGLAGGLAEVDPVVRVLDGAALLAVAYSRTRGVLQPTEPLKSEFEAAFC